jgi:hypothetical protein
VGTLSKWITAIGAAFKRPTEQVVPPTSPSPPVADESHVESPVAEDAVVKDEAAATIEVKDAAANVELEDAVAPVESEEDEAATVEAEDEAVTVEPEDEAITVEPEDAAVRAEAERSQEAPAAITSSISPNQQEIQRRRELVRTLFNDFWKGNDEKPATFVDRLNQAEGYLNERLVERGEPWQLDAATRKMLGLPPRAN